MIEARPEEDRPAARYQRVKDYILLRLARGEWGREARIPSENELVRLCGVSRPTVNRALRELADAGMLTRIQGVGTFVAGGKPASSLLELRDIGEEIAARGQRHAIRVVAMESLRADAASAAAFGTETGATLFRALLLHLEDDLPVQQEERLVSPHFAPDFLSVDFTRTTPYRYLMSLGPLQRVEHVVEAVLPEAGAAVRLGIPASEPCLMLHRRTWSWNRVATRAWLLHPGSRQVLGGDFGGKAAWLAGAGPMIRLG